MTESSSSAASSTLTDQNSIIIQSDSDELTDTLSAFLTSSLNVELVYTILKGIMKIERMKDNKARKNSEVVKSYKSEAVTRLQLKYVKICSF